MDNVQDATDSLLKQGGLQVVDVSFVPFLDTTSTPTSSPTPFPTTSPASAETPLQNSPSGNKLVALSEFTILLLSPRAGVNVGQLGSTLENYLLDGMLFGNLESVSLEIKEGSTAMGVNGQTSTAIRYTGLASFSGELPELTQIRDEQKFLLLASKNDIQAAIDKNESLGGARVVDVSFGRLDANEAFKQGSAYGGDGGIDTGVLAGIIVVVIISVFVFAGAIFVLRHKMRNARPSSPATATAIEVFSPAKALEKAETVPNIRSKPAEITFNGELDDTEFDDILTVDSSLREKR
jgi:hypothetical protein